jgi:hypothetical protein
MYKARGVVFSPPVRLYDFTLYFSRLGNVVVSVLSTGPKGRGLKPGGSDGFLRAVKIRSTPSFG